MRIVLLGANGQLGSDLTGALAQHELIPSTRATCNVSDTNQLSTILSAAGPDVSVNTTAFHQVDLCESRAADAFRMNSVVPFELALSSNRLGARLVHFSTDFVLWGDGSAPLSESAVPDPRSVYARSKLAGEWIVRDVAREHLVVRTSGLYGLAGSSGKGGNFVETMLRKARAGEPIRVVDDQFVTPTWTGNLADQVRVTIEAGIEGLVHASADGECSWFEFAREIFAQSGIRADLSAITTSELGSPAVRPAYSVLKNGRLEDLGLNVMRPWKEGLSLYLNAKRVTAG
jgi:dTDP-4-dehydrorhamnose reductase